MTTQIGTNLATPLNVETILDKKKEKQTDKLIKEIAKLEKRLTQDAKDAKSGKFSWKNGVKGILGQTKEKMSDKFSLKGVAGMLGVGSDSMIGSMLDARHESKKAEKETEKQKNLEIVKEKQYLKESGMSGTEKELIKKAEENYERKQKAKAINEVAAAKEEADYTRSKGIKELIDAGTATEDDIKEYKTLTNGRKKNKNKNKQEQVTPAESVDPVKPDTVTPAETPEYDGSKRSKKNEQKRDAQELKRAKEIARKLEAKGNVSAQAITKLEESTGPMNEVAKEGMREGILDGIEEEILKLSKEQLAQLEKLVELNTETEEARLERKATAVNPLTGEPKKEKEKEKSGGFLDMFKSLTGLGDIAKTLTSLLPMLSSVASVLGPALAVAGAAFAGYKAGQALNDKVLNPIAGAITGDKEDTVGTALHKGVDKVSSWFGVSDADNIAAADKKNEIDLVVKKVNSNQPVSAGLLDKVKKYDLPPAIKEIVDRAVTAVPSGGITKPETPTVVASANKLESSQKTNEDLTAQKEKADRAPAPSATVINNNTNNNSSTSKPIVSPPVRPLDTTINARQRASYGY